MEEKSVRLNGLAVMREPFAFALSAAKQLLRQRILIGALLALVTFPVTVLAASYTHNLRVVAWIATPVLWGFGVLYYADAMRLVFVPGYKLNLGNVLKIAGVVLVTFGLIVLCWFNFAAATSRLPLSPERLIQLRQAAFYALFIVLGTKFAFAQFALKDRGIFVAIARSWVLTGGAAFWPTFSVMTALYVPSFLMNAGVLAIQAAMAPSAWAALSVGVNFAFAIVVGAFKYPFFARWMIECEAFSGSSIMVPPYHREQP